MPMTDRRRFLMGGALAAAGATLAGGTSAEDAAPARAVLRLSSQDNIIPGADLKAKVAKMEEWGFDGLEVHGGNLRNRVAEIEAVLQGSRLKMSAICAGYQGCLISEQESERQKAVATIREILPAAGELGATGLIVVPAFNNQTKLSNKEARPILIDLLRRLGDDAQKAGTRILLEPLNRREAFFLRQLADAAAICRDVNHPAICMMGDFYHMAIEETSDRGAFLSAGKYLHHVHLASRTRKLPGQDARSFVDGFRGLKEIGYRDFCSLECGVQGDREVEIPKSVKFLRRQWEEA
ncbi:MAG: sugar phosphate isomerase/epimerase family protein [Armatimonadota bacterium]